MGADVVGLGGHRVVREPVLADQRGGRDDAVGQVRLVRYVQVLAAAEQQQRREHRGQGVGVAVACHPRRS